MNVTISANNKRQRGNLPINWARHKFCFVLWMPASTVQHSHVTLKDKFRHVNTAVFSLNSTTVMDTWVHYYVRYKAKLTYVSTGSVNNVLIALHARHHFMSVPVKHFRLSVTTDYKNIFACTAVAQWANRVTAMARQSHFVSNSQVKRRMNALILHHVCEILQNTELHVQ